MTDQELRLECLKAASYIMSHNPITVFNKETARSVDSPTVLADIYCHYVKTGSLVYLDEQDITTSVQSAKCVNALEKQIENLKADLKRRERRGFLRQLLQRSPPIL